MRIASAGLLLSLWGIGGCDFIGKGLQQAELDAAKANWESQGIETYEYRFSNACECLPETSGPIIITVFDGEVTGVRRPDDAAGFPPRNGGPTPTIPELFETVQSAIDEGADSITVEYDAETGLPKAIVIDWDAGLADEETSYTAGDLDTP
jgi:hypothetical protein